MFKYECINITKRVSAYVLFYNSFKINLNHIGLGW